jgi:hypothetical protein
MKRVLVPSTTAVHENTSPFSWAMSGGQLTFGLAPR